MNVRALLAIPFLLAPAAWAATGPVATGTAALAAVDPATIKPNDTQDDAAMWAMRFLTRFHYKRVPLDDQMSSKILERYVESLDGEKLFFLKSDADEFARFKTQLDDAIYEGELEPPFEIFRRYIVRVDERTQHARVLLEKGFDLTVEEKYVADREKAVWAGSRAELEDLWRRRVKNDWLRLKLAGKPDDDIKKTLDKRYRSFKDRVGELDGEDVFQTFMNAYASAIEPHTGFLGPRASENFSISMRLSLEGIGAVLQRDDEYTVVRQVVRGGPAHKLGTIKVGDRIVAVGQSKGGAMQDVVGWRLDDVVELIRGKKGSTVLLDVIAADAPIDSKPVQVAVVREEVKLEEQAAKKSVLEIPDGAYTRKIGVIALPTFYHDFEGRRKGDANYRSSTRDVAKLLRELKNEGVEGVVVDLRENGGGSLTEATQLSGLFIDRGPVVQVRDAQGRVSVESDTEAGVAWDGPLAVLVNRSSASASEIFAAAMQDYGRALIIGETTFGKGTVQNLVDLDNVAQNDEPRFGQLKLTIAQFFRVNGGSTQHRGVVPDISFPTTWDPAEYGESALDNALPWTSITAADYNGAGNFRELTPALAQRHEARVAKNREFQWWLEDLAEYKKMRSETELSLLESTRKAQRDAQEQRKKARDAEREAAGIKTARRDEPRVDDGLDAAEKARETPEDEEEADDEPDVLLTEAAAILSDAITLLAGDQALAHRVRAFTLADNRRISTNTNEYAARGAASSKSGEQ